MNRNLKNIHGANPLLSTGAPLKISDIDNNAMKIKWIIYSLRY